MIEQYWNFAATMAAPVANYGFSLLGHGPIDGVTLGMTFFAVSVTMSAILTAPIVLTLAPAVIVLSILQNRGN